MQGISSIIYIILVACLLPYAFTVIAKFTGGFQPVDNQNPRDFLANTKGIAARANAVQQNSFESLPLFLTAILMAEYMVVPEYFILRLGWAYIILRVIYGICYLSNWATLRSIVWFLSLLCPIFLLIVTIKLT
ncbi:MAPEG family protein [Acinetobacter baumannii]